MNRIYDDHTRITSSAMHRSKSRRAIENHGFNDAKNRYGLGHVLHHHPTSVVVDALVTFLAMCLERLYRVRCLRRGSHPPYTGRRRPAPAGRVPLRPHDPTEYRGPPPHARRPSG